MNNSHDTKTHAALRPGVRPAPLRAGAQLGLIAPAGPMLMDRLDAGLKPYEGAGFRVRRWRSDLGAQPNAPTYLAGDDGARLTELLAAFDDPFTDAIVCARGGYGSQRLLPALIDHFAKCSTPPLLKPVVGFSDITALHSFCFHALGWATLHAPMVFNFAPLSGADHWSEAQAQSWRWLLAALTEPGPQRLPCVRALPGRHTEPSPEPSNEPLKGVLLGGNLSLVDALYGSPFMPSLRGAILLLEDVGETIYRLDRMLTSLWLRGAANEVAAVVLGTFTDCGGLSPEAATDEVVRLLAPWGVPVWRDLPVGHTHPQHACWLGLGAELHLDALVIDPT